MLLNEIEKKALKILKNCRTKSIRKSAGLLSARFRLDRKTSILLVKHLKKKKKLEIGRF
jgi:hypothetical protein